jgi:cytochrome c553
MRFFLGLLALAVASVIAAEAFTQDSNPPPWAYPVNSPGVGAPVDDGILKHVPGSTIALSLSQIRDLFSVPDWHPEDHPPLPRIVADGRRSDVFACGYCHLPNGLGRPENSSLAGLSAAYIKQQVADFKQGARKSSEPRGLPVALMIATAQAVTDAELVDAANYFSALKLRPWIRVVESDLAPKTRVAGWMLVESEPRGSEPIGQRIIEMPEDLARTELRDSRSGFVAYVPVGSIEKGRALVTTGGSGKTIECSICHGPELKGLGPVPPIAARSPSYLVRQLYDIKNGARAGEWSALMKEVVGKLTQDDMVSIAAYLASRTP